MNIKPLFPFRMIANLLLGLALLVLPLTLTFPIQASDQPAASPPLPAPPAPQAALATLPVYRLVPISTNLTETVQLADRFEEISPTQSLTGTTLTLGGITEFVVLDKETGSVYQRLDKSGAFYAFNESRAFSETNRGPFDPREAKSRTCEFLTLNQLFPPETAPGAADCSDPANLPYETNISYVTIYTPAGKVKGIGPAVDLSTTFQTAIMVHVPLAINVGSSTPHYIPLDGPGGHLSLLFSSTHPLVEEPSLDECVHGLAAVAAPLGTREREVLGTFPVISPELVMEQARQKLRNTLPAGAPLYLSSPELVYYVDNPDDSQFNLEPEYVFTNTFTVIGGVTVTMRGFSMPAIVGFAPVVTLTAPADGSQFTMGQPVTFTAVISGGAADGTFTYTLEVNNGSVLNAGTAGSGDLTISNVNLPIWSKGGVPAEVVVTLRITDTNQAGAEATVALRPDVAPTLYFPIVMKNASRVNSQEKAPLSPIRHSFDPDVVSYRAGADYVRDYHGRGDDLFWAPFDAIGFLLGLGNYGWTPGFVWGDDLAWERDWRDCSLGGGDCLYGGVDTVDFAYFAGHGSPGMFYFGVPVDSFGFSGLNARYQTLRWAAFASCQTLQGGRVWENPGVMNWRGSFQGVHMLLGFHSEIRDMPFGGRFASYLGIPYFCFLGLGCRHYPEFQSSIRAAWLKAAFDNDAGLPAYIYARGTNGVDPCNETLPYDGAPPRPRPFPVLRYVWGWAE